MGCYASYMTQNEERTKLQIWIPSDLHHKLKLVAVIEGTTVTDLVTPLLRQLVSDKASKEEMG